MNLDPTALSNIILIVTVVLSTLGAKTSARGRQIARERNQLRTLVEVCVRHIHDLSTAMATHGEEIPPLPERLREYLTVGGVEDNGDKK